MAVEASALSLRQLLPLSLEERSKLIMAHGAMDLARSVRTLEQDGLIVPKNLQERIAWAVAWNIGPDNQGAVKRGAHREIWEHRPREWSRETTWKEVWGVLTSPPKSNNPGSDRMLLDELALSVQCEQREEWQPEASRQLDLGLADDAFAFLYKRDMGKVIGFLRKQLRNPADEPEELGHEAWVSIYRCYWSTHARQRFLGVGHISSLVCTAALYKCKDLGRAQRRKGQQVSWETSESHSGEELDPSLSQVIGVEMDPGEQFLMEELRQKLDECMQALTQDQQIAAELIWLQEESATTVAARFQVSKSAISQRLKKARENVRGCLEHHGYRMSDK